MFYECLDVLLPYITKIYNDSLASGTFPSHCKDSLVIPLLKKPSLHCNNLKNYRPVSNLSFISKVLERIVYSQFLNHITANKLIDKFQSTYKPGHSTETALIRVVNDMLNATDNGNLSLLTLLDLSATFDTIHHSILLERLQTSFGIDGLPLKWESYLSNRHQKVKIDNNLSNVLPILYGVPQGSVLGPLLLSMYIYPLTDVIDDHKLFYHVYADDSKLYCSSPSDQIDLFLDKISTSTDDINLWMSANKLKMNNEKTEIFLCGTNARLKSMPPNSLKIGNLNINDFSPKVKNLGMCLENNLSMDHPVSHLWKSCYLELRKIANIRSYLSDAATLKLVLSLVISKLDYSNSLFYNMSLENIHKLQLIQNHAARLVKKASKRSSAKLLLKDLHWLPV